jgi:hypothetical protein
MIPKWSENKTRPRVSPVRDKALIHPVHALRACRIGTTFGGLLGVYGNKGRRSFAAKTQAGPKARPQTNPHARQQGGMYRTAGREARRWSG